MRNVYAFQPKVFPSEYDLRATLYSAVSHGRGSLQLKQINVNFMSVAVWWSLFKWV
jgi:hypothetical protein